MGSVHSNFDNKATQISALQDALDLQNVTQSLPPGNDVVYRIWKNRGSGTGFDPMTLVTNGKLNLPELRPNECFIILESILKQPRKIEGVETPGSTPVKEGATPSKVDAKSSTQQQQRVIPLTECVKVSEGYNLEWRFTQKIELNSSKSSTNHWIYFASDPENSIVNHIYLLKGRLVPAEISLHANRVTHELSWKLKTTKNPSALMQNTTKVHVPICHVSEGPSVPTSTTTQHQGASSASGTSFPPNSSSLPTNLPHHGTNLVNPLLGNKTFTSAYVKSPGLQNPSQFSYIKQQASSSSAGIQNGGNNSTGQTGMGQTATPTATSSTNPGIVPGGGVVPGATTSASTNTCIFTSNYTTVPQFSSCRPQNLIKTYLISGYNKTAIIKNSGIRPLMSARGPPPSSYFSNAKNGAPGKSTGTGTDTGTVTGGSGSYGPSAQQLNTANQSGVIRLGNVGLTGKSFLHRSMHNNLNTESPRLNAAPFNMASIATPRLVQMNLTSKPQLSGASPALIRPSTGTPAIEKTPQEGRIIGAGVQPAERASAAQSAPGAQSGSQTLGQSGQAGSQSAASSFTSVSLKTTIPRPVDGPITSCISPKKQGMNQQQVNVGTGTKLPTKALTNNKGPIRPKSGSPQKISTSPNKSMQSAQVTGIQPAGSPQKKTQSPQKPNQSPQKLSPSEKEKAVASQQESAQQQGGSEGAQQASEKSKARVSVEEKPSVERKTVPKESPKPSPKSSPQKSQRSEGSSNYSQRDIVPPMIQRGNGRTRMPTPMTARGDGPPTLVRGANPEACNQALLDHYRPILSEVPCDLGDPTLKEAGRGRTVYISAYEVVQNKQQMKAAGITHIVNTAAEICENHFPNDFVYKTYYYRDGKLEDISSGFFDVLDFCEKAFAENPKRVKILFHCGQGVSRSATMLICFLMWLIRRPMSWIVDRIQQKFRPIVKPNGGFQYQLLLWQKELEIPRDDDLEYVAASPEPRLFQIRPHHKSDPRLMLYTLQHKYTLWKLDPRFTYAVYANDTLYVWAGSNAKALDQTKAVLERFREQHARYLQRSLVQIVTLKEQNPISVIQSKLYNFSIDKSQPYNQNTVEILPENNEFMDIIEEVFGGAVGASKTGGHDGNQNSTSDSKERTDGPDTPSKDPSSPRPNTPIGDSTSPEGSDTPRDEPIGGTPPPDTPLDGTPQGGTPPDGTPRGGTPPDGTSRVGTPGSKSDKSGTPRSPPRSRSPPSSAPKLSGLGGVKGMQIGKLPPRSDYGLGESTVPNAAPPSHTRGTSDPSNTGTTFSSGPPPNSATTTGSTPKLVLNVVGTPGKSASSGSGSGGAGGGNPGAVLPKEIHDCWRKLTSNKPLLMKLPADIDIAGGVWEEPLSLFDTDDLEREHEYVMIQPMKSGAVGIPDGSPRGAGTPDGSPTTNGKASNDGEGTPRDDEGTARDRSMPTSWHFFIWQGKDHVRSPSSSGLQGLAKELKAGILKGVFEEMFHQDISSHKLEITFEPEGRESDLFWNYFDAV